MHRIVGLFVALLMVSVHATARGADEYVQFAGHKSTWHEGFARHDFVMDEATFAIQSFARNDDEKFGIREPANGQRRCVVIVPKTLAPGNPWSWRGCYWDHQPQTEIELLKRGFHVAYISADAQLKPSKHWDAWYEYLTTKHGLSKKPAFIGMSRGGEYSLIWSTTHPDKVSCLYLDNPGMNSDIPKRLSDLAKADVPILQVVGSIDPLLERSSLVIENIYQQHGGRVSLLIKEGAGHHPHSLKNAIPLADFIHQSVKEVKPAPPSYLAGRTSRATFYGSKSLFREDPKEGLFQTCRGPWFTECYERFSFELEKVEGAIQVLAPKSPAAGNPWVFRADYVARDATVDLALLAKGFHIVTGPVPYNADGPSLANWNAVYKHLVTHGFSAKPVLAGAGAAAGEAYAWAIANPQQVACVYAENPILRCFMSKTQPLDNLTPLADADVPILHVCGSLDPNLKTQTRLAEERYAKLKGNFTVIVREGESHHPTSPKDPTKVVDFILAQTAPSGAQQ